MKLLKPDPKYYALPANWRYVDANSTDIKKTFRRVRERMLLEAKAAAPKVRELKRK